MSHSSERGFTAIELLITLFVAAAFIIAGSQLYLVVIKDGGTTRAQSRATNTAYNYLRQYTPSAVKPCAAVSGLPTNQAISVAGLTNATLTITITCPYTASTGSTGVSEVTAKITYGSPATTITNALYVTQ